MLKNLILFVIVITWQGWAQPDAPSTPDLPCAPTPEGNDQNDTVVSTMDAEGYLSLFDGETSTGWWHSCQTVHSGRDRDLGAIFRIDPDEQAIYSNTRSLNGGIIMTKKEFDHYELVFDIWPDYGNDAGIFHRTPANGVCYQTVLDYIGAGSFGGMWGENGYAKSRDIRPWGYDGGEEYLSIPGNSNDGSNWTENTAGLDPTSYGCAASGCVEADWQRLWDFDGWNEFKCQFYGGITNATTIKMKTWFRKPGEEVWVPILHDTTLTLATPPGFIGFQVHQGDRFSGEQGIWYRNIRWKPLDENGQPLWSPGIVGCMDDTYTGYDPTATVHDQSMCGPLSIQESSVVDKEIEFHPERISVTVKLMGTHKIHLLDANGKVLDEKEVENFGSYSSGKSKVEGGVYFLQVITGKGKFTKKYFIE
ncbi:family 16 glycoside hydrolase [Fibrobacterota bacterium]